MPKRTDLQSIPVLGSGPIRIGQGVEFDYSGTQAVRAVPAWTLVTRTCYLFGDGR
jgi:hypothetical protein